METSSESIQKFFIADFGIIIQYFDYPHPRMLTNDEYMDEFGDVMKI